MNEIVRVSSTDFQKGVGRYQDVALTQPVMVTRNGRDRTVMISAEEYHLLRKRARRVMGLADFTNVDIAALEAVRAPADTAQFDTELPA